MEVFRIAKTRYVADLAGTGARLYGGRWNYEGVSLIYTSTTRALATVEFLVHVPIGLIPKGLGIATIELPDDILPDQVSEAVRLLLDTAAGGGGCVLGSGNSVMQQMPLPNYVAMLEAGKTYGRY